MRATRRESRPFRTSIGQASRGRGSEDEVARSEDTPPFSTAQVEFLERCFTPPASVHSGGLDGAIDTAITEAEQRGREEVISMVRRIAQREID